MQRNFAVDANQPQARGFAQSGIRVANERAILTLIALRPGSSNADLARSSGLGPQTTSRIVGELETRELIRRGEPLRGRRGQPATPLFINPQGAFVIGVEIGWRSLELVLLSMEGRTLATISRSYSWPDAEVIFARIADEVAQLSARLTPTHAERLIGIGVACPGDIHRGVLELGATAPQAVLWQDIDIAGRISELTGLEVDVVNDGSAACWSEWLALPQPWPAAFACLHVGTFISSGINDNGTLWQGRSGNAANLGAIIVPGADGKPSTVQDVASLLALQHRLEAAGTALPHGNPLDWDWSALQPAADAWLDDAARALATAIVSTRAIIELDLTLVDGVMPRPVVARLVERVNHHLAQLPRQDAPPTVALGAMGGVAAASGVAQLMLFRRYFSRAWNLFVT